MKYIVKGTLSTQHDVNLGEKDKEGHPLPVKLESVVSYNVVTNIVTSGSLKLTDTAIKASLREKLKVTNVISESLVRNNVVVSGSIDDFYNLFYSATIPYVPVSGSI